MCALQSINYPIQSQSDLKLCCLLLKTTCFPEAERVTHSTARRVHLIHSGLELGRLDVNKTVVKLTVTSQNPILYSCRPICSLQEQDNVG